MSTNNDLTVTDIPVEVIPEQTIIYHTRKIATDAIADMDLMQMTILDKIIETVQPAIKQVTVFSKQKIEQLSLFRSLNENSGLIEISFKIKDFGYPKQYYNKLREALFSLVTLPIKTREIHADGTIYEGVTTLLAGVKFEVGIQRCEWDPANNCFVYFETPRKKRAYRQREVILEFRKDILHDIISGAPNGYIKLIKEHLEMFSSIYSNRMYKLISGLYDKKFSKDESKIGIFSMQLISFRRRMGLDNALERRPLYNDDGEIIRFDFAKRMIKTNSGGLKDGTHLYQNVRDLKRRVLNVGIMEINKISNFHVEYRLVDISHKKVKDTCATHIEFTITKKPKGEINLQLNANIIKSLLSGIFQGKITFNVDKIINQDNVIELRNYVDDAYQSYEAALSGTGSESIPDICKRLTQYLKSYE